MHQGSRGLRRAGTLCAAVLTAVAVTGCPGSGVTALPELPVENVDLLFMVDNTGSMTEEQASLAMELPRLVRTLATGDRTGDGPTPDDFRGVTSLHVGVITSDMGVGGFNVPTCTRAPMFGDDGLLRTEGNASIAGCLATYPAFLEYEPGVSLITPEEYGESFRCMMAPTSAPPFGGCGWEQQLEAVLKAVTPSTSAVRFFGGTPGHADLENAGFLRPDSVIAVVLVTDEDDCSVRSGAEDIWDQMSPTHTGDLNLRCYLYKDTLWPVQRYIDGLRALRPGRPDLLVVAAITGVPVDLVRAGTPDYAGILADPRMIEAIDLSGSGARLSRSCDVPGRGIAWAPRRIVEVAQGFDDHGVVQSICQESYAGAVDAIIAKVAVGLGR